MTATGTYATPEQVERMRAAMRGPYILGTGGVEPQSPLQVAHACALEAGLPEIEGYYGCDLATGEFVSADAERETQTVGGDR
jgi:hypothetical protein